MLYFQICIFTAQCFGNKLGFRNLQNFRPTLEKLALHAKVFRKYLYDLVHANNTATRKQSVTVNTVYSSGM